MLTERQFIARGLAAGVLAGVLGFVFSRIFAEPVIDNAIDYESARDAAQDALNRAAGLAVEAPGHDPFTRGAQSGVGIGTGLILFGLALGGIFSVVYVVSARRWPGVRPRVLALRVGAFLLAAVCLVPSLKYPANPPSIGHPDTIGARTGLYLLMVLISVVAMVAAIWTRPRVATAIGGWNATLAVGVGFAVVIGVAMIALPPLGHLHGNVSQFGRHATETPLPLRDPQGRIVFPGFSADTLYRFRLYSVLDQTLIWGTISVAFGALCERMYARAAAPARVGGAVAPVS